MKTKTADQVMAAYLRDEAEALVAAILTLAAKSLDAPAEYEGVTA